MRHFRAATVEAEVEPEAPAMEYAAPDIVFWILKWWRHSMVRLCCLIRSAFPGSPMPRSALS